MRDVLLRNVYADGDGQVTDGAKQGSLWLADYLLVQIEHLKSVPTEEVLLGRISWAAAGRGADRG